MGVPGNENERFEEALGTVDGVNVDFQMNFPYVPGTLRVFLNGRMLRPELDNGWTEADPSAGTFRMKVPPVSGDTVFGYADEEI